MPISLNEACANVAYLATIGYEMKTLYSSQELFEQSISKMSEVGKQSVTIGYTSETRQDGFEKAFSMCINIKKNQLLTNR